MEPNGRGSRLPTMAKMMGLGVEHPPVPITTSPIEITRNPQADDTVLPDATDLDVSFTAVFNATSEKLARFATALTRSRTVGEDITQEAFVRLYVKRRQIGKRIQHPEAYLRRTIVNLAHDRTRRKQTAERADNLLQTPEAAPDITDSLLDSLGVLSDRQRAAVVLRFYLQCSEAEIADALRCRPGTVKSLLSRSMQILREVIPQ
jgi:RNA polymerase sigma factor (sigma-70 family)